MINITYVKLNFSIIFHLVGSSKNKTDGLSISSSAIDSRLHSPPDKREIRVCWLFVNPSVFITSSIYKEKKFTLNYGGLYTTRLAPTVEIFSLLETALPSLRWAAEIMYSSTVRFLKR